MVPGRVTAIAAIGVQGPALRLVLEVGEHDLLQDLLVDGGVLDGRQALDPPVEVARHPVGRGDEYARLAGRQWRAGGGGADAAGCEEAERKGGGGGKRVEARLMHGGGWIY